MLHSAFHLFILDSNNKLIVKGLHSAYVEPLRCVLTNTFNINLEKNSQWQLSFTAYDDGSVAFNMLSVESSVWWDNQEYIIKQFQPDYSNGITTFQVTAIHVAYEVSRIRQRETKTGTLTYTVNDVLSFYLKNNTLGFTWEVIGNFDKQQITDLGNGSGKDMLDKIISTWPDVVFYPDNKNIRIYQHASIAKNLGNRIDYLHDTPELKLSYDSTNIVNQVMAYGKQKDNASSDKAEYYFPPFMVTDETSVSQWGLHPGEDVSDERFTDANTMKEYALSQLSPQPTLSIEATETTNEVPTLCEIRRLENRKDEFVTEVEVVAYTYYPLDKSQATSITLNNRAKTILNYQSSRQKGLEKTLNLQKEQTRQAKQEAHKAWNARLIAQIAATNVETKTVSVQDDEPVKPSYILTLPKDNPLGLPEGTEIPLETEAENVKGLNKLIQASQISYEVATESKDGLMPATAMQKLNAIRLEPVSFIKMIDSITGLAYIVTIENGEIRTKVEGADE